MGLLESLGLHPTQAVPPQEPRAQAAQAAPPGLAGPVTRPVAGVDAPYVTDFYVSPSKTRIPESATVQLTATGIDSHGEEVDLTMQVEWTTNDRALATVDANGLVTAGQAGEVIVKATHGESGLWRTATIGVDGKHAYATRQELQGFYILPHDPLIPRGDSVPLQAFGEYATGAKVALSDVVSWSSSDRSIVNIGKDGRAYGRASGNAKITASLRVKYANSAAGGTIDYSVSVDARVPVLKAIGVEPRTVALAVGGKMRLKAFAIYADGRRAETLAVKWVSDKPAIASVSLQGLATGEGEGTARISAVSTELPTLLGNAEVKVAKATLQRIRIDALDPAGFKGTLVKGQRLHLRAVGLYPVGSGEIVERALPGAIWSSSDDAVASVSDGGIVSALKPGNAAISVEGDGGDLHLNIKVTAAAGDAHATPAGTGMPPALTKAHAIAKASHEALQKDVRALDDLPKWVKLLSDIVFDLKKTQDPNAVRDALSLQNTRQLVTAVRLLLTHFEEHAVSAQQHIDRALAALKDFEGRVRVREYRAKAEEVKKSIKAGLSMAKGVAKLAHGDPVGAFLEFLGGMAEVTDFTGYNAAADALEKELDDAFRKALGTEHLQAKEELANAKKAIDDTRALVTDAAKDFENMRRQAEDQYDANAKPGDFQFAKLRDPLQKAARIADELAPAVLRDASVVNVGIVNWVKQQKTVPPAHVKTALQQMNQQALSWWKGAKLVKEQADSHRQHLNRLRDEALRALSQVQVPVSRRRKT